MDEAFRSTEAHDVKYEGDRCTGLGPSEVVSHTRSCRVSCVARTVLRYLLCVMT